MKKLTFTRITIFCTLTAGVIKWLIFEWFKEIFNKHTSSRAWNSFFFRCIVFCNVRLSITKEVVPLQFRKNENIYLLRDLSISFMTWRARVESIYFIFLFHKRWIMKCVCTRKDILLLHQKWSTSLIQSIQNYWCSWQGWYLFILVYFFVFYKKNTACNFYEIRK